MALETLRKDRAAGRFERKLLIHVIEDKANQDPEAVYAEFPISATGFEEGFYKVTYAAFVNAINGLAWWLHETLGPSKDFETLAYIGLNDLRYYALLFGAVKAGYKVLLSFINSLHRPWLAETKTDTIHLAAKQRGRASKFIRHFEMSDPHFIYSKRAPNHWSCDCL